ncbi:MAG: sulfotransferase [Gammaproteobacteria bacterium]
MSTTHNLKNTSLDAALNALDDSPESRDNFIETLAGSIIVLLADRPWSRGSAIDNDTHLLLVSDGDNQQQVMLVIFTNHEQAAAHLQSIGTTSQPFQHFVEIGLSWALLGSPLKAGILLNPNSDRSFRIPPEVVDQMRADAQLKFALIQLHLIDPAAAAIEMAQRKPLLPPEVDTAHGIIQQLVLRGKVIEAEQYVDTLTAGGMQKYYVACLRAIIARQQGEHDYAAQLLNEALQQTRDARLAANFRSLLAQVLDENGKAEAAEQAYFQAQSGDPLELANTMNLASFLGKHRRLESALTLLKAVIKIHPSDPAPAALIAQLLVEHDQFDGGLDALEELVAKYPNIPGLHYNRAVCLQMLGRLEEAMPEYEEALRLDPNMDGHSQYVHTRKFAHEKLTQDNLYIQMLERRCRDDMPTNSRIDADFALAKIYDTAGDTDRAFAHLQSGNALKRATFKDYSIEPTRKGALDIINLYDEQFIERFKNTTTSELAPIFVLGMPRSGTTLTEQILAAHSRVNPGGEMIFMGELADSFLKKWTPCLSEVEQRKVDVTNDLQNAARSYTNQTAKLQSPDKRFTDKMPGNYLNIGLIRLVFPHASIIHCRRHPMDICLSCYEHLFSKGLLYSYNLQELGEYYKIYSEVMQHWRRVLPPAFMLDVQYGQLVEEPENQIRRILDFCGLEFEAACMQFQNVKRSVKTASSVQVRMPLYKTSVNRWLRYREKLAPLIDILGSEVVEYSGIN